MPSSYGTPSLPLGICGVCVVNKDCVGLLEAAVTVNVAVPALSPVAEAVSDAVPAVSAVKRVVATPLTGDAVAGLKEPDTPLAENVIALVAVVAVFPEASWIVAL